MWRNVRCRLGKGPDKAAKQGEEKLKRLDEQRHREKLAVYEDWRDSGNALYAAYKFREALDRFRRAEQTITMKDFRMQWAEIQFLRGNAESELGTRISGKEGSDLLRSSIESCGRTLTVYTHKDLPQQWAATQNNLGNVLSDLGIRIGGQAGAALLQKSVTAYRAALVVRTKQDLPQDWAMTQNNLGNVLCALGIRTGEEEGEVLLQQAEAIFQKALEIFTFEHIPPHWATTKNNLAQLYETQKKWDYAVQCYLDVAKVYPGAAAPFIRSLIDLVKKQPPVFKTGWSFKGIVVRQDSDDNICV